MEIVEKENGFEMQDFGNFVGEVVFHEQDNVIFINHTFVVENYRGQKIAEKLVDRVVEFAQKSGKKITPVCSYAVKYFERRPELKNLLTE